MCKRFLLRKASLQNCETITAAYHLVLELCYGCPRKHYNYPALHVETEARREQVLPQCTQPTSGGQFVPGSVFLTIVFKYNFVLSKQSNAFALKQSFVWAQSYSEEKGTNELFP